MEWSGRKREYIHCFNRMRLFVDESMQHLDLCYILIDSEYYSNCL